MNKNDCLKELKNYQWLKAEKKVQHNIITWVIQLGAKIMKQSQFDILLAKMEAGFKEVRDEIKDIKQDVGKLKQDVSELKQDVSELKQDVSILKTDMKEAKEDISEIKRIVTIHDHAMVEHGWFDKANIK